MSTPAISGPFSDGWTGNCSARICRNWRKNSAVLHKPGAKPNLDAVLGDSRDAFLERGFAALPRPVLRQLLRNPDLLLELPDLVYREGSNAWFSAPLNPLEQARAEKVAANVHAALTAESRRGSGRRWVERAARVAALAAAVLVAVTVFAPGPGPAPGPSPTGWGFN